MSQGFLREFARRRSLRNTQAEGICVTCGIKIGYPEKFFVLVCPAQMPFQADRVFCSRECRGCWNELTAVFDGAGERHNDFGGERCRCPICCEGGSGEVRADGGGVAGAAPNVGRGRKRTSAETGGNGAAALFSYSSQSEVEATLRGAAKRDQDVA